MLPVINACLGILYDASRNSVLLACRPPGKSFAGYWEFPGGKLEVAEDAYTALSRELMEELGISVIKDDMLYLQQLQHEYPHALVILDVILIKAWSGKPRPCESQQLGWYCLDSDSTRQLAPLLPTTHTIFELLSEYLATL